MTDAPARTHRRVAVVGVLIVVLSVMGILAAAFTPVLVRDHPRFLLVLEARNRYLLLVAAKVSLATFLLVGVPRRLASDPLYFLLGRWYGDRAVAWVARRDHRGAAVLSHVQRRFDRVANVLVFLFPGALVSVLAGAGRMSWRRFLTLNVVGSCVTVLALWWLADEASGVLRRIVAFNDEHAGWLTVITVAAVAGWLVLGRRRGGGPAKGLRELGEGAPEPDDP
jgi:membrane protein DedA with SNARE-associated domain